MTPQGALAYARDILEKHQQMNSSHLSNAELARHAVTAAYLMEFATRIDQLEAEIAMLVTTVEATAKPGKKK